MSAKNEKHKRKFEKELKKTMVEKQGLCESGSSYFNYEEDWIDWFITACQMKVTYPDLTDEDLLPDKLPLVMTALGEIDLEELLSGVDIEVETRNT